MFPNHNISTQSPEEFALLIQRIRNLSTAVMTASEWQSILTAAETLLPRRDGKRRSPVELDLSSLNQQPRMQLFDAVLTAFAHEDTYKHNRRYSPNDWTRILESFADLSLYLLPPPILSYGPALCTLAIKEAPTLSAIHLANALGRIDPRVLRQRIRHQDLENWSDAIVEVLRESIGIGEHTKADSDATPDDYDDWRSHTRAVLRIADDFYEWAKLDPPEELQDLDRLLSTVQRPEAPEEQEPDLPTTADERDSAYWTLERIFEDL
jgi:hypothetical protein